MNRSTQRAQIARTLDRLTGGIVVSCQARPGNPLEGVESMVRMARAAELGGARAIRANGPVDCKAILAATDLPLIGNERVNHRDGPVRITPTIASATGLLDIGVEIVALDATTRQRPGGQRLHDIVGAIHEAGGVAIGDLAAARDLEGALAADIDAVSTALSDAVGHTVPTEPDFTLLAWLVRHSPVPVFAEGRYWTPDQVREAFALGARFVVIGTAITNPMAITSRFVQASPRRLEPG